MLKIAIVEDHEQTARDVQEMIQRYAQEHHLDTECRWFPDGEEIAAVYESGEKNPFDIVLLDIEMRQINGMDAARRIRDRDKKVVLSFITNMAQYAIHGYEVNALDFILKPVEYFPFSMRLDRMVERVRERTDVCISFPTSGGMQLIPIGEIRYFETGSRMLYCHAGGKVYTSRMSMKEVEKSLRRGHFAKCNQCYLVNLSYVNGVQDNVVTVDGEELFMSRRNKTPFLEALSEYLGSNN